MLRMLNPDVSHSLRAYLKEALGIELRLRPCEDRALQNYLIQTYEYACSTLLGTRCVFVMPRSRTQRPLSWHSTQLARISDSLHVPAVLVVPSLSSKDRLRLVAKGVPFIVPFAQLYLPPLGIDFRERTRSRGHASDESNEVVTFPPVTQMVLIEALLRHGDKEMHAGDIADRLRISAMSVSRAFTSLEAVKLLTRARSGRSRPARLAQLPEETWRVAQPYLATPVRTRSTVYDRPLQGVLEAGPTALARVSNLLPPPARVVAIGWEAWRAHPENQHAEPASVDYVQPGHAVIEVWNYPPDALTAGPAVDPLSLYLSLRESQDERIEIALEEMMATHRW